MGRIHSNTVDNYHNFQIPYSYIQNKIKEKRDIVYMNILLAEKKEYK